MKTLGEYRKDKNMTQIELHKATGIPLSSIAMYETGERTPSLARARKIAKFFNVSTDEIFFGLQVHNKRANEK
ncbi:putative transcriptional regulator [Tissierella praeacuta DSM 18095]|uniref:Putative transcriptional regulator n=1 Tax=Tissierella praeacuta DSM 18095 TaxID=1123404 RepID=A0A1M4WF87_9FIRM|nr:helix-turn-helix transcriptional regulator [Tissierella praeacuta]SHE79830.1 putative transcriptional regulator [Tissierella praeacuta DSM 18095]SUO99486.1 Helix-turn-helix [Tissierella praeacuta]